MYASKEVVCIFKVKVCCCFFAKDRYCSYLSKQRKRKKEKKKNKKRKGNKRKAKDE